MIDTLGLLLRLALSMGAVLGLMWLAARLVRGPVTRGLGIVELLGRQQVGRGAAVAVLRVADRALVVGVTDTKVTLLTEADLHALEAAAIDAQQARGVGPGAPSLPPSALHGTGEGPLTGSVLCPGTWRRALQAVRDRTARRG